MARPHDRIALVTGAGSGIGAACANALLADGWRVVYTGRREQALKDTIAKAGDPWGDIAERALAVPCDVTQPDQVDALYRTVQARFGRLDLLFNNAGVLNVGKAIDEIPFEVWKTAVDTNLTGAFLCTQHAFRMMKQQSPRGGRIVHNGSISAHVPRPNSAPYTATKHAIAGLTKSAALDGRAHDIAVGQIDIGNAATDMVGAMQRGILQADGSVRSEAVMEVEHVADALVHIASLPLHVNVLFMNVMATKMPFVGRG